MIAVFLTEPGTKVHAVFQILREGLKVKAHGYCGAVSNAADGTFQIPEWAFDGREKFAPPGVRVSILAWSVCPTCVARLKEIREPARIS